MTLPLGTISLNQIHVEAGGTSGTKCSINDSDIRGLIDKTSAATMSFSEWRGAQRVLDTQTINVSSWADNAYFANGTGYLQNVSSYYNSSMSGGTINDGTSNFLNNGAINLLYYFGIPGLSHYVYFSVSGTHAKTAFTTMNVNGHDFASADASFSTGSHSSVMPALKGAADFGTDNSIWIWTTGFTASPFTAKNTDTTVVWK